MPKRTGKKKTKKKANKTNERDVASVQLGSIANRTMVQQMASETLSVSSSSRDALSSKERVRVTKSKYVLVHEGIGSHQNVRSGNVELQF